MPLLPAMRHYVVRCSGVLITAALVACGGDDSGTKSDTQVESDTSVADTSVVTDATVVADSDTGTATTTDTVETETTTTDTVETETTATDTVETETTATDTVETETTTDTVETETTTTDTTTTDTTVADTADTSVPDCTGSGRVDGCACENDADCASGLCASGPLGDYCTSECAANDPCPDADFTCVIPSGQTKGLCVVEEDFLCMPCKTDAECKRAGGDVTCRPAGPSGSFCASACVNNDDCFDGYTCTVGRCVPSDGTCECNEVALGLGAATTCTNSNGLGTCSADRVCLADGSLSACNAPAPTPEVCDGIDNDCNTATPESGSLCNDGNPCTQDVCSGVGGCTRTNLTGTPCDDGDACTGDLVTGADSCQAGVCTGPDRCPCTPQTVAVDCVTPPPGQSLSCNTATCPNNVCVYTPKAGSCSDGSACTINDTCSAGVCAGTTRSCADASLCTVDTCDPSTGCVNTPFTGACEDGDPCTIGDTCATGQCIGTTLDCSGLDDSCHLGVCDGAGGCAAQTLQCGVSGFRFHTPSAAFSRPGTGATWLVGSVGHGGPVGSGSTAARKVQFGFHPGVRR